jgi:hypothetical protein
MVKEDVVFLLCDKMVGNLSNDKNTTSTNFR